MNLSSCRTVAFSLGLCVVMGTGVGNSAPERVPRDKVIHPILGPDSAAEVLPESRKAPAYPEKWRKRHLGAQVILQVVIDKRGIVTDVDRLKTHLRVERESEKPSRGTAGGTAEERKGPKRAARDFEDAAIDAVRQWRFRPGTHNGAPVAVYQTLIIEFSPCPGSPTT